MSCIRCEVIRAQLQARLLLGFGFSGQHICAKLSRELPGEYYTRYDAEGAHIMRFAQPGGQPFEIVVFDRPIDSG